MFGLLMVVLSACIPSAYLPSPCVLSFFLLFVLISLVDCVCLPGTPQVSWASRDFTAKLAAEHLFGWISVAFLSPFVSFWLAGGSHLAPFGSLFTPLGAFLAALGSFLTPFVSLLAPFGSLSAPLA